MKANRRSSRSPANRKLDLTRFEVLRRAEEKARHNDWQRILSGQATPEEIQGENSPFSEEEMRTFRILDLEQSLLRIR
jgi:hypothetical protein